jgi:hypothetical protein
MMIYYLSGEFLTVYQIEIPPPYVQLIFVTAIVTERKLYDKLLSLQDIFCHFYLFGSSDQTNNGSEISESNVVNCKRRK